MDIVYQGEYICIYYLYEKFMFRKEGGGGVLDS